MNDIENADGQSVAQEVPQEDLAVPELNTTSQIIDDSGTGH
jgi:hypothetical protein